MSFKEWREVTISEIATKITKGTTPTTLGESFTESGINFIKAEAITFGGIIDKTKFVFINPATHEKLKRSQLEEDDILFSMAGMVLGKTAVVTKDVLPANTNQALGLIRLNKTTAFPKFVDYYMRQKSFFDYVNSSTGQSAQPNINLKEIGELKIKLPSLDTQKLIASILSSLDYKIELNRQTNQTLEAIAQAIFKEWFVDFNFPGATGEMQDSELGEIPRGWEFGNLGQICYVQNGYAFKSADFLENGTNRVIKIKNISGNIVDVNTTQFVSDAVAATTDQKFEVVRGDLLIAMTGAEVGKIGLVPQSEETMWLNQRVGSFKEKILHSNLYLYILLSSPEYQNIIQNSALGSAQPNISGSAIENIKCMIPDEAVLTGFGKIVFSIFDKILENIYENQILTQLRDSLLPKLMKGEITINYCQ